MVPRAGDGRRTSCLNIDPDRWFALRPGQRMLQTFHGYPSKSMGIRMWAAKGFTPRRIELELARTSGGWASILTPAPEMDEHYRREYRYDGPISPRGYPRDDVLVSPDAERIREETRARLGIAPGQTAVLYAPTWRDDLATNWRAVRRWSAPRRRGRQPRARPRLRPADAGAPVPRPRRPRRGSAPG